MNVPKPILPISIKNFIGLALLKEATVIEPTLDPAPPSPPNQPNPLAPTSKTSLAKTGNRVWYGRAKTVVITPISIKPTIILVWIT